jgi:hypothetical protein
MAIVVLPVPPFSPAIAKIMRTLLRERPASPTGGSNAQS